MLPDLKRLEGNLNGRKAPRLIKARGLARLSAWFALGHTLSDVARYTIDVDQQGNLWRTDATPSDVAALESGREEVAAADTATVAVGISITGSLETDVRSHITESRSASKILFLRPNRELGRTVFTSAADVAGFARTAEERIREFVKEHRATRLLLFYFGPLSGACFLGHQRMLLPARCRLWRTNNPGTRLSSS